MNLELLESNLLLHFTGLVAFVFTRLVALEGADSMDKKIGSRSDRKSPTSNSDEEAIAATIRSTAQRYQGDQLALLNLLRMLEALHKEIREGLFQESLPTNRQALYALLKDIEAQGGWPYIKRRRLQSLLELLEKIDCAPAEPPAPVESVE